MPDEPDAPTGEPPLPAPLVLGGAVLLTALLSVWAAFLVPVRIASVPLPLWLVPSVAMLGLGVAAGRRVGLPGALLPALTWLAISVLGFGSTRDEGDLVVPGTPSGALYLYGGMLLWAGLVVRTAAGGGPSAPAGDAAAATPARRTGR